MDATGAIADAACESGSLTSAQFVTPMSGAFGTACVMDASGAVAQHVVIEPTGAQPPAGKTQPDTDEPTGGNPAGDTKPGSEEKPGDETKPSENPPPRLIRRHSRTPSLRPRPPRRLRPRLPRRPSSQQRKPPRSLRPATVTGWLRALPSSSRYVVGHHKSSVTSLGALFDNVVSAASFPHFSGSIMQIA